MACWCAWLLDNIHLHEHATGIQAYRHTENVQLWKTGIGKSMQTTDRVYPSSPCRTILQHNPIATLHFVRSRITLHGVASDWSLHIWLHRITILNTEAFWRQLSSLLPMRHCLMVIWAETLELKSVYYLHHWNIRWKHDVAKFWCLVHMYAYKSMRTCSLRNHPCV